MRADALEWRRRWAGTQVAPGRRDLLSEPSCDGLRSTVRSLTGSAGWFTNTREMIGKRLDDLNTPALVVDLDAAEANFAEAVTFLTGKGKSVRPHFKVHRSGELARWQLARGGRGFTCARLDEVQALLDAGLDDVLLANTFAGRPKCRWAAELARRGNILCALDNEATARQLADQVHAVKARCRYVIDVDLGMGRSGVASPQDALALYGRLQEMSSLRFAGLMGYEGHLVALPNGDEKTAKLQAALATLSATVRLFRENAVEVPIVSAGGTGSYHVTANVPEVTELQMGTFFAMDDVFREVGVPFRRAAAVVTRVVYCRDDRVVLDCGMKGMHPAQAVSVRDDPGLVVEKLNAEHAICTTLGQRAAYRVGDVVLLNVSYADGTFNLYSRFLGVRGDTVAQVFPRIDNH